MPENSKTTPSHIRTIRMFLGLALLVFLAVIAFNFLMQPSLPPLQQGQTAYLEGRSQDAIDAFSNVIDNDANNPEAYLGRGFAYMQMGFHEAAKADFERALALNPDNADPRIYDQLGFIALNQSQFYDAVGYYDRVLELSELGNTASAFHYFNRGMAYFGLEEYENAILDFETAIEIDDTTPIFFFGLGNAYYDFNRFDEALAAYEQYISLEQSQEIQEFVLERLAALRNN